MANSLIETLSHYISPELTSRVATTHRESQPVVTRAFLGTLPVLLGMVTSRAHDRRFMNEMFALANSPANDSTILDDRDRFVSSITTSSREVGLVDRFQSFLLGSNPSRMVDTISKYANIGQSTAWSVLTAAMPLVLACLGRMIRQGNLDSDGLARRLSAEHASVANAIPAAFTDLFSDATRAGTRHAAMAPADVSHAARGSSDVRAVGPWVALAIALAAVAATIFYAYLRQTSQQATRAARATPGAVGTTGTMITRPLPTGVRVRVPATGSEARLLAFVTSSAPLRSTDWIQFDRIRFYTDSAVLTSDSNEQLTGIADIMKAYPRVRLTIGGYTDNTGDPAANLKLSEDRAMAVRNQLVGMGVAPDRLKAKGYGAANPIATNATEQGRAENRRVAFQVSAR
jgi:outer membrane protein OmpA-like peptidoglycan-associated protein